MNEDQWEKIDCNKASDILDSLDDYARMEIGVDTSNLWRYLQEFINNVELIKRSQVKQVPALFKKDGDESKDK